MSFGDWGPYISVAEKRERAQKLIAKMRRSGKTLFPVESQARKVASSFWGKAWCTHLEEHCDYDSRLPRGRSYLRHGCVIDLQIGFGEVRALINGSSLYKVKIKIKRLQATRWDEIVRECNGQVQSLLALLQGQFSDDVMAILCDPEEGLLPQEDEISMSCSCPDWAVMCKHVAAALYGVGVRLDEEPALLFDLRQVDSSALLIPVKFNFDLESEEESEFGETDLSALFGIEFSDDVDEVQASQVDSVASQDQDPDQQDPNQGREPDLKVRSKELRAQGVSSAQIQSWLRLGILQRTSKRAEYTKTARGVAMIARHFAVVERRRPPATKPRSVSEAFLSICKRLDLAAHIAFFLPAEEQEHHSKMALAILFVLFNAGDELEISTTSLKLLSNDYLSSLALPTSARTLSQVKRTLEVLGGVELKKMLLSLEEEMLKCSGGVEKSVGSRRMKFARQMVAGRKNACVFREAARGEAIVLQFKIIYFGWDPFAWISTIQTEEGPICVVDQTHRLLPKPEETPCFLFNPHLYKETQRLSYRWITHLLPTLEGVRELITESLFDTFKPVKGHAEYGFIEFEEEFEDEETPPHRWVLFFEGKSLRSSAKRKNRKKMFILATNLLNDQIYPPDVLLSLYQMLAVAEKQRLLFSRQRRLALSKQVINTPSQQDAIGGLLSIAESLHGLIREEMSGS